MTEQKHRTVQVIIIEKWDFFCFVVAEEVVYFFTSLSVA